MGFRMIPCMPGILYGTPTATHREPLGSGLRTSQQQTGPTLPFRKNRRRGVKTRFKAWVSTPLFRRSAPCRTPVHLHSTSKKRVEQDADHTIPPQKTPVHHGGADDQRARPGRNDSECTLFCSTSRSFVPGLPKFSFPLRLPQKKTCPRSDGAGDSERGSRDNKTRYPGQVVSYSGVRAESIFENPARNTGRPGQEHSRGGPGGCASHRSTSKPYQHDQRERVPRAGRPQGTRSQRTRKYSHADLSDACCRSPVHWTFLCAAHPPGHPCSLHCH